MTTTLSLMVLFSGLTMMAQTTSFTYQGKLSDSGNPANGSYDLQFALWDSLSGGTQIGVTQTVSAVAVSNGVFTVSIDFGAGAFNGANRFLEIGARPAGGGAFTILTPRQQITSTPYAIRSLNASSADSVVVNGVPSGSGNYIQNSTTQQASSNFNINGDGTAAGTLSGNVVNAATQYNLGGNRILSGPGTDNLFIGPSAGQANTTGARNTFTGARAGQSNVGGQANAFYGTQAGFNNNGLGDNSFFGYEAGFSDITGHDNSYFGYQAGLSGNGGINNSFFGAAAGSNTGINNTQTVGNSYFGAGAGLVNRSGNGNTMIGANSEPTTTNLDNATAIGYLAVAGQSNSMVLGSIAGLNSATSSVNVGIGTTTPSAVLSVVKGGAPEPTISGVPGALKVAAPSGTVPLAVKQNADESTTPTLAWFETANGAQGFFSAAPSTFTIAAASSKQLAFNVGATTAVTIGTNGYLHANNRIIVDDLGINGDASLCRNSTHEIALCGLSSLRFKKELAPYRGGLDVLDRLRPISFTWKTNGKRDFGLGAEDVAKVEPLLTFSNDKGEVEGVKYEKLTVVLINSIKEQQEQIAKQQQQIDKLTQEVRRLRTAVRTRKRL